MWSAIQYVTTPLTLVAFVAAVVTFLYRERLKTLKALIDSAESSEKQALLEGFLETYHLQKDNLTREQKFQLVNKVLDQKLYRLKIYAGTLIILALIGAGTFLLTQPATSSDRPSNPADTVKEANAIVINEFINVSDKSIKNKTVVPKEPLPVFLTQSRGKFESYWATESVIDKRQVSDSVLFRALMNNIRIYRAQETYDQDKVKTNEWLQLGISYFDNSNDQKYISELLLENAGVILEMTEQNRSDRALFRKLVADGDKVMARAYSIQDKNSKDKVLRIWSRFYYDLSKPESNIFSREWDNTYLKQAYRKALQAFNLDSALLKNSTQLCRCLQKLCNNPPQDVERSWTPVMKKTFRKHAVLWKAADTGLTNISDRIAPLNILAVLGLETIFREWNETKTRSSVSKKLLMEIDSIILPAQEEVVVLVEASEYKKPYSADVNIDLSRIHLLKVIILTQFDKNAAAAEFREAIASLRKAKASILGIDQLAALKRSTQSEKLFTSLNATQKNELRKMLDSD